MQRQAGLISQVSALDPCELIFCTIDLDHLWLQVELGAKCASSHRRHAAPLCQSLEMYAHAVFRFYVTDGSILLFQHPQGATPISACNVHAHGLS